MFRAFSLSVSLSGGDNGDKVEPAFLLGRCSLRHCVSVLTTVGDEMASESATFEPCGVR